jgi:hypothetical protein
MDSKTRPSNIYTMVANEHEKDEKESNEQLEGDEPIIEKFVTINLHIHMTRVQIKVEKCIVNNILETKQCYYVDMPHTLVEVDDRVEEINIENILNIKREDMVVD